MGLVFFIVSSGCHGNVQTLKGWPTPEDLPFTVRWEQLDPSLNGIHAVEQPEGEPEPKLRIDGEDLYGLFFLDDRRGWGVGTSRAIFATVDGGKNWTRKIEPDDRAHLAAVAFANANTGWAVGSFDYHEMPIPYLLTTTDGGESWTAATGGANWSTELLPVKGDGGLDSIVLNSRGEIRIRGSVNGTTALLQGRLTRRAPYVTAFQVEERTGSIRLTVEAASENPAHVELVGIAFRAGRGDWNSIQAEPSPKSSAAKFSLRWKPGDYGIGGGTKLSYRVTLRDDSGLQYRHVIPGTFVYRSWWNR